MIPVKSTADIQKMRRACQIAAAALQKGGEAVRPGITTAQLDKVIHQTIVSMGGKPACLGYCGFPAAACISVNDVVIHGIPGGLTLKEGDIVGIDLCVSCDGFIGDNAATFACGSIDPEAQRLLDVTKESLARGIAAAQAGNRIGDISAAVQTYVEENGYSVIREYYSKLPFRILANVIRVMLYLCLITGCLLITVRRNTAISCNPSLWYFGFLFFPFCPSVHTSRNHRNISHSSAPPQ